MSQQTITVFELYESAGDGSGNRSDTLGWFDTMELAQQAASSLRADFCKIEEYPALRLENGKFLLLRQIEPISLGMQGK